MCTDHPASSKGKITIIGRNSTSNIENEAEQRKGKFPRIYIYNIKGNERKTSHTYDWEEKKPT